MSWTEYGIACEGHYRRYENYIEPLRNIAALIYNSNVSRADMKTPQQLWPLAKDEEAKMRELKRLQKNMDSLRRQMNEDLNKIKNGR